MEKQDKGVKMKLKRRVEILPGLKVDMELFIERDSLMMLKIDPQIIQGSNTVEYILNFEKEFAEEFRKTVIAGAIDWNLYNVQKTKKRLEQEIANYEKCLANIIETVQTKIEITRNILKILEQK